MPDVLFHREEHTRLTVVARSRAPNRAAKVLGIAGPLILFWLFTTATQWLAGAFSAELGQEPDETAHYVTGLMIADYAKSGAQVSPMEFAERFYVHYPRVAFGMWPPLYHITLGAWMFAFGGSRESAVAMQGLLAAILALLLYGEARRRWGIGPGLLLGLVLLSLNSMRVSTASVMADVEVAVFACGAALLYARYLETERARDGILFGLAASAAILTKYNGLALAGLPALAVALNGKWRAFRTPAFWLPAGIVTILCGPWYATHLKLIRYAAEPVPGIGDIGATIVGNGSVLVSLAGPVVLAAAVAGAAFLLRRGSLGSREASGAALIASVWGFHCVAYPIVGVRYFLPAIPFLLLLSVRMGAGFARRTGAARLAVPAACAAVVISAGATHAFGSYAKPVYGFSRAAERILRSHGPRPVYMVAADSTGEGALVAEVAMREQRPRSVVLRASKVLASSTEMGQNYRALYRTPEELLAFLEGAGVAALVLRPTAALEHHRQLVELLVRYPERWRKLGRFGSPGHPVEAFALLPRPGGAEPRPVRIDMRYTLQREIE